MTMKQIAKTWLQNFLTSALIIDGKFNTKLAKTLFHGLDKNYEGPFKQGFATYSVSFEPSNGVEEIDELINYLHFIGITIQKQSILNAVQKGGYTYQQIVRKAYFIFKQLSRYDEDLDINDPFKDNMGDFFFFLKLEEGGGSIKQLTIFDELELPEFYNKYIELPKDYENNETAKKLYNYIENSNESFFLTGKAGTGKSTFVHYFTRNTQKQVLLVAFTGIAAINIGGQTLHSFFKFPLKPLLPNDPDIPIFKEFYQKRKILEATDTIIIDEVSMLRSDLLEGLDYSLRKNGGDPNKVFGGKQLIFVGDIFQLPPIVEADGLVEKELFRSVYKSEYFFDSLAYKQLKPRNIELNKVHRQQNESFIALLNRVRDCTIDEAGINKLNRRFNPHYEPKSEEFNIMLTTNNSLANAENKSKIGNLPYRSYYFKAVIEGDFKEDKYPNDSILELKRNAQVMLVRNDSEENGKRWVNGTLAKIEYIDDNKIEIRLKDGRIHLVQKEIWENRQYQWDKSKGRITSKVIGTFEQFPVRLAWAITIHKSQGLTFDKVILDLGLGAFVNGQLYTALSRCKTLDGITLKRKIQRSDIIEDRRLTKFYEEEIQKKGLVLRVENILDYTELNNSFLMRLISVHYPFTFQELSQYDSIIKWGSAVGTFYDSEPAFQPAAMAQLGLAFNSSIEWSHDILSIGSFTLNNYQGTMYNESSFPLSIQNELSERMQIILMHSRAPEYYSEEMTDEYIEKMEALIDAVAGVTSRPFDFKSLEELIQFTKTCLNVYCLSSSLFKNFSDLLEQRGESIKIVLDKAKKARNENSNNAAFV